MREAMTSEAEQHPLILNVDDYEPGRYVVTRILERAQFRVREASNGEEALRLAAAERFDLVLLDVNLPDLNGFEVCRRLKADTGHGAHSGSARERVLR